MTDEDADLSLPTAHPAFATHFTDPIYEDSGDEFAPFGSDEGSDSLATWAERRSDLSSSSTVRELLEVDTDSHVDEFIAEATTAGPDIDAIIVGTGFALLRLTGQIDQEGRQWVVEALERLRREYDDPATSRMLDDLATFG